VQLSLPNVLAPFPDHAELQMRPLSLAVILLAACSASPTSSANDLRITASVTPAEFRAGDATTVAVVVTNHGGQSRKIHTEGCPPPFVVTTFAGTVVGPTESTVCSLVLRWTQLAPGESYTFTQQWKGDAHSSAADARGLLPPGTYLLRGRLWLDGDKESTPVTIRVAP
jgi:hypothetical protein